MEVAKSRDPDFRISPDELASHYLNNSGLDQRERKDISKYVGGVYDAQLIKEAILKYSDQAQELDEGRVLRSKLSKRNQGRNRANFVMHCPEKGSSARI